MIKLIAIDLDGTLLTKNLEISKENLAAIKQARERGVHVVIATGRPMLFTKPYMKVLNLDTPYIMYNGGHIMNADQSTIESNFLTEDQVLETVSLLEQHNTAYMLYTDNTVFYKPCKRIEFLKEMAQHVEESLRAKFELVTDFKKVIKENKFNKVLIVEENKEQYPIVYERFMKLSGTYDILMSSSFYIEVIPKGTSKGTALEKVGKLLNVKQSEIMAIGDQENDVTMIEYAGIGIAMGNAIESVKKQADYVTLTNKENGVAHAIKRFVLET